MGMFSPRWPSYRSFLTVELVVNTKNGDTLRGTLWSDSHGVLLLKTCQIAIDRMEQASPDETPKRVLRWQDMPGDVVIPKDHISHIQIPPGGHS